MQGVWVRSQVWELRRHPMCCPDLLLPTVQGTVPSGFLWLFHPERRLKRGRWLRQYSSHWNSCIWHLNWFCLCASPLCILDSPLTSTTSSVCFNAFLGDSQLWVFWDPCHHAFLKIGCSACLFRVILGKSIKGAHMCFFLLPLCRSSPVSCWSSESITVLCKDGDPFFISWSLEAGNIKYLHSSSFISAYFIFT